MAILPASALATTKAASPSTASTADQAKIQVIINRGNSEIIRRLNTLNTLSAKINATTKLSAGDKSSLSTEVSSEIGNLTSLRAKLDADTDLPTAKTDAQSIINDYRVYALVVPKVDLVKTADDQQVAEGNLTTLAGKLQSRLTSAQGSGKTVTGPQRTLADLNSEVAGAEAISSNIETTVIGLQPSDYNTNPKVLSGDRDQLKTAQGDIQTMLAFATPKPSSTSSSPSSYSNKMKNQAHG